VRSNLCRELYVARELRVEQLCHRVLQADVFVELWNWCFIYFRLLHSLYEVENRQFSCSAILLRVRVVIIAVERKQCVLCVLLRFMSATTKA
jgi:hypothetical protein